MIWLLVIYSLCAIGIIAYTFKLGNTQEDTDRRIAELKRRISPSESNKF